MKGKNNKPKTRAEAFDEVLKIVNEFPEYTYKLKLKDKAFLLLINETKITYIITFEHKPSKAELNF